MKQKSFIIILALAFCYSLVYPQQQVRGKIQALPQRLLKGKVFSLNANGEKIPETRLVVVMEQTGNSDDTNDLGIFMLPLPQAYNAGEVVNLVIDKPGWRIPSDGKVRIPHDLEKDIVEVEIVPTNPNDFWTDARVEKLIIDVAEKSKQQVNPKEEPQKDQRDKIDFSRYIKEWAVQYGYSAQQAKEEIDKWIAEIEAKSDDYSKLGLAAFARKNFPEAAKYFEESVQQKSIQLEATKKQKQDLEEKEKKLTNELVKTARLAGDSYYNDYQFDKAFTAYQQALKYVDRIAAPDLWASISIETGNANRAMGIRAGGSKIQSCLNAAIQAYQQALEIWSRETEPEGWASVQMGIGNVLSDQGIRTVGDRGAQLLAEAVAAYRLALLVRTCEQLPQDWAMTQNNLGTALQEQGLRTAGEQGAQLLSEAVTAYKHALEIRTHEHLPWQWAHTQSNLSYLYHEVVFNFQEAFVVNQELLKMMPDDISALCDFAEKHFTTGRFPECEERLAALLANQKVNLRTKVALRTIEIANLLALNKAEFVPAKIETLQVTIARQPGSFTVGWTFGGDKHFVCQNGKLAPHRQWLIRLFEALEQEGRENILTALKAVRESWKQ